MEIKEDEAKKEKKTQKEKLLLCRQSCTERRAKILVGNKVDLQRSRLVSTKGKD